MQSTTHPVAVAIARGLLLIVGFVTLTVGAALYFYGVEASFWVWLLTLSIGVLAIISACFEAGSGVVATIVIFFYPLS